MFFSFLSYLLHHKYSVSTTASRSKAGDIVAKCVFLSAQNLILKLRGRGRKRAAPKSRGNLLRRKGQAYKKRHHLIRRIFRFPTMSADAVSVSTVFDILATRPVHTSTRDDRDGLKHKASVDQSDLEFLVPEDHDTYIDLNYHLYIRGKLTKADGADLENTDHTAVTNIYLHSLFRQCSITNRRYDNTSG